MMHSLPLHFSQNLFEAAAFDQLEGDYDFEQFDYCGDSYKSLAPSHYILTITNVGGAFLISGTITAHFSVACSRCLEDAVLALSGEVEGYYIFDDGAALADRQEDEFDMLPSDHTINLADLLYAAVLVELPVMPLCSQECKGLCTHCGANLNFEACNCAQDTIDEIHPFAALKDLQW